jgi:hypothetical protein
MDRPSPELFAALCLVVVGAGTVTAAADATDPSPVNIPTQRCRAVGIRAL